MATYNMSWLDQETDQTHMKDLVKDLVVTSFGQTYMQVYGWGLAPIPLVMLRLLVLDYYSMLLKGSHSHTFSITPFTGSRLVLRASLLKGPCSHTSSNA
jgi:hypothetical protein